MGWVESTKVVCLGIGVMMDGSGVCRFNDGYVALAGFCLLFIPHCTCMMVRLDELSLLEKDNQKGVLARFSRS
jgi:hypothetical protein